LNPVKELLSGPSGRLSIKRFSLGFAALCMGVGIIILCVAFLTQGIDTSAALWPLCGSLAGMCGYGYVNGIQAGNNTKDKPPAGETD